MLEGPHLWLKLYAEGRDVHCMVWNKTISMKLTNAPVTRQFYILHCTSVPVLQWTKSLTSAQLKALLRAYAFSGRKVSFSVMNKVKKSILGVTKLNSNTLSLINHITLINYWHAFVVLFLYVQKDWLRSISLFHFVLRNSDWLRRRSQKLFSNNFQIFMWQCLLSVTF